MCEPILTHHTALFTEYLKEDFMSLYMDRVPNVKIMFARILKEQKLANGPLYFDKELNKAIQWLKSDPDSDVGYEVRGLHVSLAVEDEMSEERKGVSSKTVSG